MGIEITLSTFQRFVYYFLKKHLKIACFIKIKAIYSFFISIAIFKYILPNVKIFRNLNINIEGKNIKILYFRFLFFNYSKFK